MKKDHLKQQAFSILSQKEQAQIKGGTNNSASSPTIIIGDMDVI